MREKCDVFISYRRKGGQDAAMMVYDALREKGLSVFLDVSEMDSGMFDEQLMDKIEECQDFILICSPEVFDRCWNKDDWVYQELAYALEKGKNVIPVLLGGFVFPSREQMPEGISEVCLYQSLSINYDHFDAFSKKLYSYLKSTKGFWKKIRCFFRSVPFNGVRALACSLAAVLLFVSVYFAVQLSVFPGTKREKGCFDRLISYQMGNLGTYDQMLTIYTDTLGELERYIDGTSSFQRSFTFDEYACRKAEEIRRESEGIHRMDDIDAGLVGEASKCLGSKIDIGDANAMPDTLLLMSDSMIESLGILAELYIVNDRNLKSAVLVDSLEYYRKNVLLDRDSVFYTWNGTLLSVNSKAALEGIMGCLSKMPAFYQRQDWVREQGSIQVKLDSIYNEQKALLGKKESILSYEEEQIDILLPKITQMREDWEKLQETEEGGSEVPEEFLRKLDLWIDLMENQKSIESILYNDKEGASRRYEENIRKLKDMKTSLESKYQELKEQQMELEEMQKELDGLREEAREKFKPLPTDDADRLWGKGLRFITLKMPDMAEECFHMCADAEGTEAAAYVCSAVYFVQKMEETGVTGGGIVCGYEDGLPRQDFQIGDILYAVNGQEVRTAEEFIEARGGKDAMVSVLRFSEDGGFQKLEVNYDSEKGRLPLRSLAEEV